MSIIIKKQNSKERIDKTDIKKENELQKMIYDDPETIPLYDIDENIKLLILCREYKTNVGALDAVGIDQEGNIYIVETKLYRNPDKRNVVAQMLDYGASLWINDDYDSFIEQNNSFLDKNLQQNINQRIKNDFNLSNKGVEDVLEKISLNLKEGNFKYVVLMDELHKPLKDLIRYINQNSEFDIYAVELEYYKHQDYEIIIPKIFGAEIKKDIKKGVGELWNKEKFIEKISQIGNDEEQVVKKLINWFKENKIEISWSTSIMGSFIPEFYNKDNNYFYPISVRGDGVIVWNAPHQGDNAPMPFNTRKGRLDILKEFNLIEGFNVDINNVDGYNALKIPFGLLKDEKRFQKFCDVLLWIRKELQTK